MLVDKTPFFSGEFSFIFSDDDELNSFVDQLENRGWKLVKSEADKSSEICSVYIYEKDKAFLEITLDKLGVYRLTIPESVISDLMPSILKSIEDLKLKIPLFSHKKSLRFLKKYQKVKY